MQLSRDATLVVRRLGATRVLMVPMSKAVPSPNSATEVICPSPEARRNAAFGPDHGPRLSPPLLVSRRDSITQPRVASPRATLGTRSDDRSTLKGLKRVAWSWTASMMCDRAATLSGLKRICSGPTQGSSRTRNPGPSDGNPFRILKPALRRSRTRLRHRALEFGNNRPLGMFATLAGDDSGFFFDREQCWTALSVQSTL